jgi:hypothetical protein
MSHRAVSKRVVYASSRSFALAAALGLGACGEGGSTPAASVEPGSSSDGTSTTGSHSSTGGPTGTNSNNVSTGPSGSSSGFSSTSSASGGSGTSGTSTSSGGGSGGSGSSGASGSSSSGEVSSTGDVTSGSEDTTSGDTSGASSSSDETSGTPSECTRELLDSLMDEYLEALASGDPAGLPLAANVKFTENAEEVEIGTTAFWMNAGDAKHSQRALDVEQCSVAAQAVIPEGTTDLPIGIRIKVEAGQMTEIETIVVRQGDYTASFAVDNDPQAIIDIAQQVNWHDEVPPADRASREDLAAWVDKYFRAFPSGVCDVTTACRRLENGGGNFSCGDGASCNQADPGQGGVLIPRLIIVDEVRGIAAGFTIFEAFGSSGHLDMHMVKMYGGQVHAVHAMLRNTDGASGWD